MSLKTRILQTSIVVTRLEAIQRCQIYEILYFFFTKNHEVSTFYVCLWPFKSYDTCETKFWRNLAPKHGLFRFLTIKAPLNRVFFTAHSRNKEYCIIFFRRSRALYWYSVHKGHTDEKNGTFFVVNDTHELTKNTHTHTHLRGEGKTRVL